MLIIPSHAPSEVKAVACRFGELSPDGTLRIPHEKLAAYTAALRRPRVGLGDCLARLFWLVGITWAMNRWQNFTRRPCRCAARRDWLNRFGWALFARLRALLSAIWSALNPSKTRH